MTVKEFSELKPGDIVRIKKEFDYLIPYEVPNEFVVDNKILLLNDTRLIYVRNTESRLIYLFEADHMNISSNKTIAITDEEVNQLLKEIV